MNEEERADLVVIGGGPAGTTCAATAARAGLRVVLLEAGEHPRPHVGESLLPGIIPILADIGALDAVESAGFGRKTGSTLWNWGRTPRWDLWFSDSDAYDHAWLVDRSPFDALLFDHARGCGADLRPRTSVRQVQWSGDRCTGVRWRSRDDGREGILSAPLCVDASGPAALVARALDLRRPIAGLQHQAMWAHFERAAALPPPRQHQALFVAQPDQWWWLFPLAGQRASVGVVQLDAAGRHTAPRPDFDAELAACSELADVLGPTARRTGPVRHERDWSWRAETVAGPGWIAVGDAAGFIDPVLSTGVMLALHSGWHAARNAIEILGGRISEAEGLAAYRTHHREMFEDLLRMVRFYYRQNLHRDDYFWESKEILVDRDASLQPLKAFVILTSGLVQNLPLEATRARTEARVHEAGAPLEDAPERLGFVAIHLRHGDPGGALPPPPGSSLYVLVEPLDPAAPALFRTRALQINAVVPGRTTDPIRDPAFAPILEGLRDLVQAHDAGDSLAAWWRRARPALHEHLAALPEPFALVRVFGE